MYLDGLIDLLKHVKSGKVMGECNNKGQLVVRKDANGQVVVNGVTHCVAKTAGDLEGLLDSGMRKRHVASTKMNSESSRSHLIATIMIEATDRKTKLTTTGKLTLVDLAGSESQKKTGATGNQLKEAKAINSSLSALGAVISASPLLLLLVKLSNELRQIKTIEISLVRLAVVLCIIADGV